VSNVLAQATQFETVNLEVPQLEKTELDRQFQVLAFIEARLRSSRSIDATLTEDVRLAPELSVWAEVLTLHAAAKKAQQRTPVLA
jgi:hypothetical protein